MNILEETYYEAQAVRTEAEALALFQGSIEASRQSRGDLDHSDYMLLPKVPGEAVKHLALIPNLWRRKS